MGCRRSRSSRFALSVVLFLIVFYVPGCFPPAFAQNVERKTAASPERQTSSQPYRRDDENDLNSNWNHRRRRSSALPPGESAAALRLRANGQKMAMRTQRAAALPQSPYPAKPNLPIFGAQLGVTPNSVSPFWVPLGPAPLASDATGDGMQDYNWVSGRATSVLIDPADTTGNTVLLGGAYGGLWRSTNAGSASSNPGSVVWQPLIDDQPTLSVGAIALQPVATGNPSNVILAGTGETNSSGDSYYGLGILRSADGGSTWTQIPSAVSGQSFLGIGFSKIAFSTANPRVVAAATAGDNGLYLGLEQDAISTARGLYNSQDGGATWNRATLSDGAVPASATSVIYNPSQGATGIFYAFIRRHGLYSSADGQTFTRLPNQPGAGLASANCPAASNAVTCLIYRGEFAVVAGRNEMYAWVVDVQPDINGNPVPVDEGIWQTTTGGTTPWTQIPDNGITNCGDNAFGHGNSGCGVEQGYYNLELAAIANGSVATDLYAGAINLYKCTLAGGTTCTQGDWINLTHVYGCNPGALGEPAHVHPDQHGIAFMLAGGKSPGYFAHDGGISRTLDGYTGLNSGSCAGTNQFDSLSQTLGSMTEFVSFSVHPTDPDILLGGTQDNGSPKTQTATSSSAWQNALGGDGGFNAINPNNPSEWFAAIPYLNILKCETGPVCNNDTFSEIVSPANLGGDQGAFYTPYILDPQNTNELLIGTCRVWRVSTSGAAPLQLSNDFDNLGAGVCTGGETNLVNAVAAGGPPDVHGNSTVIYAVTDGYGPLSGDPGGEVWVTTNAGVTLMTNATGAVNPQGYAIAAVAIDNSDTSGDTAYVGIMGFSTTLFPTSHVWKTATAGATWADWTGAGSTALPDAPVNALLVDSATGQIYAGTDVGVFVSSTAAPSWAEAGPAPIAGTSGFLPDAPVTALRIFNNNAGSKMLMASTYGRGIWSFSLSPNFTNVISNSPQTIFPTQTALFNGILTTEIGYASPVNLSCIDQTPALQSCTLNPTQAIFSGNPTAPYTVTATGTAGDYSFVAHAAGTDTFKVTHDAPLILHVVDFNLAAPAPNSLTVGQGETSAPSTFQVTAQGSFDGAVALSCPTGLPTGAACIFSPSSSVSPTVSNPVTVTLTVTAATNTPRGGPFTVQVSALTAGAPSPKTQTFALMVTPAGASFTWTDTGNSSIAVLAGQSAIYTFSAAPGSGGTFTSAINFACTGLPALTGCTFNPASIAAGAETTTVTLTISTAGPNPGAQSLLRSGGPARSARSARGITPLFAFVWVLCAGLAGRTRRDRRSRYTTRDKPHVHLLLAVVCLGLGFIAQISCGGLAASSSSVTPDFSIAVTATPNSTGISPQAVIWNGTLTASGGYIGSVAMSCGSGAPGVCMITPSTVVPAAVGAPFTVTSGNAIAGTFNFVIQGTDGAILHATPPETLTVTPPGPPVVTVTPGSSTLFANEAGNSWPTGLTQQHFTATVSNSTSQTVTWTVSGGFGGANGTIDASGLYTAPAAVPNPATVTVTATSAAAAAPGSAVVTVAPATVLGTSQITVSATEVGGASNADVVTLIVQ